MTKKSTLDINVDAAADALVKADQLDKTAKANAKQRFADRVVDALALGNIDRLTKPVKTALGVALVAQGYAEKSVSSLLRRVCDTLTKIGDPWHTGEKGKNVDEAGFIYVDSRGGARIAVKNETPALDVENSRPEPTYSVGSVLAFLVNHQNDFASLIAQNTDKAVFSRIVSGMAALQALRTKSKK